MLNFKKIKKLLIIGPDIDNEISGPSIGIKNLLYGFNRNNIKYEIIKGFKIVELIKIYKIFFYKNIYLNGIANYKIIYYLSLLFPNKKFIIGPNYVHNKSINNLKNCMFLAPSNWYKKLLLERYGKIKNLNIFKFPINNKLINITSKKKGKIIIYYKNLIHTNETNKDIILKENILKNILKNFKKYSINYKLIEYGAYNQEKYIEELKKAKLVIFITGTETQGIAKYEALALNIPILNYQQQTRILDNNFIIKYGNTLPDMKEDIYGKDFIDIKSFIDGYNYIINNIHNINPKKFIIKNFSSKKLSLKLFNLFNKF